MIKKYLYASCVLIALTPVSLSALAQDNPGARRTAPGTTLNEIIVSSQRREQSAQKVPISVTALPETFLIENGVHSLEDLNGAVPGFVTTNSVNYGAAPLSIRGIGGANGGGNFFADEPVAVYVDGIYITGLTFSTADLFDIQKIEVMRGPQGTLYGRNSTAGALLIKSARPTDEFEGYVRASGSSLTEWQVAGAVSGPLVPDLLKARVAVQYSDRNGWGNNLANGQDVGGSEDISTRLSLEFTPNNDITISTIGEYQHREATPATLQVADLSNTLAASPFVKRPDFNQVLDDNNFSLNSPNFVNSDTYNILLSVNWDLGWATLDSITGYRDYALTGAQDSDGTGLTLFNNNGDLTHKQWTQEVRLTSNDEGRLTWIAGFYYIHSKSTMNPFQIRNFNALFGVGTLAEFRAFQKTNAYALFADATLHVTDRLSLTVGGRYSHEKKDFSNDLRVDILNGGTIPPFAPPPLAGLMFSAGDVFSNPPAFASNDTFHDFSPRVVVDFDVTDDILAYASYTQGFKSGGFNAFGLAPSFGQENIDAVEIGIKSDLADKRLRLNVSAFYYDYKDLQVRLGVPTGGVEIANAANATVKGVEVETTILPFEGLTLTGNLSYLDAEIDNGMLRRVPEGLAFPIGAPIPLETVDVSGNRLSRSPKWQSYISGEYRFPVGNYGTSAFKVSYRYQSNVFFLETNQTQPTFRSGNWHQIDLRLSFMSPDERWEIAVFGQNITDERHITQITQLGSFPNAAINEPAKWGGQISVNF